MIILIDNYDSFTYNLYHFLGDLGAETVVHRNDKVSVGQVISAKPSAIVISPGPATPNEAGICLDLIAKGSDSVPILGVCLGHQAIGQHFGGTVMRAPEPVHGKPVEILHDGKTIFNEIPNRFAAGRYHSLIVDRKELPDCMEISAESPDGLIMGLRHREWRVEGVQFHPESILTEHGRTLLRNFLEL